MDIVGDFLPERVVDWFVDYFNWWAALAGMLSTWGAERFVNTGGLSA